MVLYSGPLCPYSHRTRILLAEKGIGYDIVSVSDGEVPEELMDLNPYGSVPTLVDRDLKLYQSRIIMEYLDERFPHPPLLPVDPVNRALTRLFMHRIEADWHTLMTRIQTSGRDRAAQARKQLRESIIAATSVFDAKPFFMSDEFSMADCYLAPLLWRLPSLGVELGDKAGPIFDYMKRIFERDSFQRSLTDEERDLN